jgi:hypothetical protein
MAKGLAAALAALTALMLIPAAAPAKRMAALIAGWAWPKRFTHQELTPSR